MDSKEYFIEVRNKYYKMQTVSDEIQELKRLSECAGALDYSKERVQSSGNEPSFLNSLEKADDRIEKYMKLLNEYEDYREEALSRLNTLSDGLNARILHMKFFKFLSLEKIADELNYSFATIRKRYWLAMKECDSKRIWEDNYNE